MKLTLEHGLSVLAPLAFVAYGLISVTTGNLDEAYRFSDLSLILLERYEAMEWLPRVYAGVYGFIRGCKYFIDLNAECITSKATATVQAIRMSSITK